MRRNEILRSQSGERPRRSGEDTAGAADFFKTRPPSGRGGTSA